MSALYTALVESETKETLAASLLQHREALWWLLGEYRSASAHANGTLGTPTPYGKTVIEKTKATLDTMIFRAKPS